VWNVCTGLGHGIWCICQWYTKVTEVIDNVRLPQQSRLIDTIVLTSGLWHGVIPHSNLMFMGPYIVIIFWYIIPTRRTSHRVYLICQLVYMFRASLSPVFRSTKQLHLQHLVTVTPYCCLLLSWRSWNWFGCVVGGVFIRLRLSIKADSHIACRAHAVLIRV
jgi:hypothetical protein